MRSEGHSRRGTSLRHRANVDAAPICLSKSSTRTQMKRLGEGHWLALG